MTVGFQESITKIVGIGTACCTALAGMWSVFSYINEIKTKYESSQERVSQLEITVKDLKAQMADGSRLVSGLRGERGERGFKGDPGPEGREGQVGAIGPIGPAGPKGDNGLGKAEVQKLIEQIVAQKIQAKIAVADGSVLPSSVDLPPRANIPKGCIARSNFIASTLILKIGIEFCADDGEILSRVTGINSGPDIIYFHNPSSGGWSCNSGFKCEFNWLRDRYFNVEKIFVDDNNKLSAQIRIKSKS